MLRKFTTGEAGLPHVSADAKMHPDRGGGFSRRVPRGMARLALWLIRLCRVREVLAR